MDAAGGASGGGVVDPTALLQLLLSQMVPRPPRCWLTFMTKAAW